MDPSAPAGPPIPPGSARPGRRPWNRLLPGRGRAGSKSCPEGGELLTPVLLPVILRPRGLAVDARNANPLLVNQGTYVSGDSKYDFGGDLGGYIKKDKLFWYGGFNPQFVHDFRSVPPVFGNSNLGTISVDTRTLNYQGKV